ncbi:MAG: hypothetical protein ACFB3T_13560 [Geminicoccaceae bacterium]
MRHRGTVDDDDQIGHRRQPLLQLVDHGLAGNQFGHVRIDRAARQQPDIAQIGAEQGVVVRACKQVGQTRPVTDAQAGTQPVPGAMGIDQQDVDVALGVQGQRQVQRRERLAFTGPGTGDHNDAFTRTGAFGECALEQGPFDAAHLFVDGRTLAACVDIALIAQGLERQGDVRTRARTVVQRRRHAVIHMRRHVGDSRALVVVFQKRLPWTRLILGFRFRRPGRPGRRVFASSWIMLDQTNGRPPPGNGVGPFSRALFGLCRVQVSEMIDLRALAGKGLAHPIERRCSFVPANAGGPARDRVTPGHEFGGTCGSRAWQRRWSRAGRWRAKVAFAACQQCAGIFGVQGQAKFARGLNDGVDRIVAVADRGQAGLSLRALAHLFCLIRLPDRAGLKQMAPAPAYARQRANRRKP